MFISRIKALIFIFVLPIMLEVLLFGWLGSQAETAVASSAAMPLAAPVSFPDPIAYWSFDDGVDPTHDLITGNHNGDLFNNATFTTAVPAALNSGQAISLDGNNDYVFVMGDESDFDFVNSMSVAFWAKVDSFDRDWQAMITKGDSTWRIQRYSNSNQIVFGTTGTNPQALVSTADINDGQWHHVAAVFEPGRKAIYIDGVLDSEIITATGSIATNNSPVLIGANAEMGGREFNGSMDDVRIYDVALSAAQIAQLAAGDAGFACFSESSGDGVTDFASNDAQAVQRAVDQAGANDTVKAAGTCAGVQTRNGFTQTLYISQSVTVQGGYTPTNWTLFAPITNATTLDAEGNGRVVYIPNNSPAVTLDGLIIRNGYSADDGGGIWSQDTLTINNSHLISNTAQRGGAIFNGDPLTVNNSAFLDNSAGQYGGGIFNNDEVFIYGTVTISRSLFSNNMAGFGGGIFNYATVTVGDSTLSGNTADFGGGIATYGIVTINSSTLSDNVAHTDGGSLFNASVDPGDASISNSILANSPNNNDCYTTVAVTATYTLIENSGANGCNLVDGENGNIIGQDPKLGALADNGGDTFTHALLPGSPAIDTGDSAYPAQANDYDQRGVGYARVNNGRLDIGAYESPSLACFVDANQDGVTDYSSADSAALQTAIDNAAGGDILRLAGVCAGTQNHLTSVDQTAYISQSLTLQGGYSTDGSWTFDPALYTTTLDAEENGRVIYTAFGSAVVLSDLIIQNGSTLEDGGGIFAGGVLTISNSLLRYNSSDDYGGGLFVANNDGVTTFISNSAFISNTSYSGGGGFYTRRPITIANTLISQNVTHDYGGGGMLDIGSQFSIQNSDIVSNTNRYYEGGGLYIYTAVGHIQSTRILNNTALGSDGGGLYLESYAAVDLANSEVAYNQAAQGGGIHLYYNNSLIVQNSAIHHNQAIQKANGWGGNGGGISMETSALTMTQSTVAYNSAENDGGGIGAIARNVINVVNSTVSQNQATRGGGVYGEVYNSGGARGSTLITLTHATLYSNTADLGGSIYLRDPKNNNAYIAQATFQNSIIAGNSAADCATANGWELLDAMAYNLDSDGSCVAGGGVGNQTTGDPGLGPLQNNGGDTETHALLRSSPALDAIPISSCPLNDDQRGVARPQGSGCDIGAFESRTSYLYLPLVVR